MVKKLLDKGTYPVLDIVLDIDDRGRSSLRMMGVGMSQEEEVDFEIKIMSHVVKGWPAIKEPEPKVEPDKRGPGRPKKIDIEDAS